MAVTEKVKRTECVKVCFTEREMVDLGRMSARERRRVAEMVRYLVCRDMYGMVNPTADDLEVTATD